MRLFMLPSRHHRHPLLRLLAAVVGIAALGFLFVFGLLAIATLLVVGVIMLALRQWRAHSGAHGSRGANPPPAPPGVIEGEFVVIQSRHHATH